MNSKGWKVSLFTLAAVVALSACGEKKKSKPVSPYTGIWIETQNIKEYSTYRGQLMAGSSYDFCKKVYVNRARYRDESSRVKVWVVQANGEVFRYSSEAAGTPGYRESNYVGTVTPAGLFVAGSVGLDGRTASYNQVGFGYVPGADIGLPPRATFNVVGNSMRMYSDSSFATFSRHSRVEVEEYRMHVASCLNDFREAYERAGREQYPNQGYPNPGYPNPMQKDCDPEIQRCEGGPQIQPYPYQPQPQPPIRGR